ncbi:hypothetical protein NYO98_13395 [Nocardioides sp. STR2]|uniref:FtsX-like permease family protein n=1 Tax=Nocardioides pini TaxID=2975053 RepID=A0ABT4CE81_9ACTN|nr:hypothetical protein [Nocardioides pini]MCY4727277.1 hypothetical protein [Nocardioides pini]
MTLRLVAGWWARRGTHLPVAAAIAVVTAATVLADGGGRPALLVPLVVLAAGVLPGAGLALGNARRQEAALLRLHGRRGARWVSALVAEPLLTAVLGGAVGVAVPLVLGAAAASTALVAAVWLVATTAVVTAMVVALRGPLTDLLRPAGAERARRTSALAALVPVVVAVGAVVGLLRRSSSAPDAWAFTAPVVVGLAAGLLAAALVRLVAGRLARRPDLGASLAGHRLALPRATTGLPVLVGSAVLLGCAANTAMAVHDWARDTSLVTSATPVVVPYDGPADQLLDATREADPDGRWLMAAIRVLEDDRPISRRVYLDTSRYERVVGDRLDGTAASDGSARVADLGDAAAATDPEPVTSGRRLTARLALDGPRPRPLRLDVLTVSPSGAGRQTVFARPTPGTPTEVSVDLTRCETGCRVTGLEVAIGVPCGADTWAQPRCQRPTLTVTDLDLGGLDLLARPWVLDEPDDRPPGEVVGAPARLRVRPSSAGTSYLTTDRSPWATPVLATESVEWPDAPEAPTTGGMARPARVLATAAALPVVGAAGTVLDLPTSVVPGTGAVARAEPLVLARADTPEDVLAQVGTPRQGSELSRAVVDAADGGAAGRFALLAAGGALLGLLAVALPAARLRRERTHERAVLRLVGVRRSDQHAAGRLQVLVMALAAGLASVGATLLVVTTLSDALPVLAAGPGQLPLDTGPRVLALLLAGTVATALAGLATWWTGHVPDRSSLPARLREEVTP